MLTQIRHIQKGTLIVVTVIIVIAFAFLYSDYDSVQGTVGGQNCIVKVYDRCYRQKEVQKLANHYDVAFRLGMYDFAMVLFGENRRDQDRTDFVMSLVVLREEAKRHGIEPTQEEIKAAIPTLPVFQQPFVDARFVENNILGPSGFTDGDLAQLVKDYLSFQKLRDLIGAGVAAVPSETERRYIKSQQRYSASMVKFDREAFSKEVTVTDEEVKEYFGENEEFLLSEPKRGFEYVKFSRKPVAEDATNEQKAKADLAFANAVNRAYADLADEDADFVAIAKQYEGEKADFTMSFATSEPFAANDPPKEWKEEGAVVEQIFSEVLQLDEVTVPIASGDGGYYVFHFSQLEAPRPLSLEEATPAIRKALVSRKSNRSVNDAANAARAKLNEALEAGKSFAEAAKAAGVEPEVIPNFSEREPPADTPNASFIVGAVSGLAKGELSEVVELPAGEGFLLVHVDDIVLYEDENKGNTLRTLTASEEAGVKRTLFTAWFNQRRAESGAQRSMLRVEPAPEGEEEEGGEEEES